MSDTITTAPVTPTGPPHRKHSRRFRVLRAAGIGFTGLVVIGAVSSAIGGPQAKPAAAVTAPGATTRPTVTATATVTAPAAPATTAPASPATTAPASPATAAPAAPAVSAMDTWCAGTGDADLQAVEADDGQLATDAGNSDLLAVEADGGQLATDADAAIGNPPPVTHAQQINYVMAMGAAAFAGSDAAAGDITSATTALTTAAGYANKDQGMLSC